MSQTNQSGDDAGRNPLPTGTLRKPATPVSDASSRSGRKLLQKGIRVGIFISVLVKKTAKPPLTNTAVAAAAAAADDDAGAGGNALQVQAGLEVTFTNLKHGEIWYCGRFISILLTTLKKSRPQVVSDSKPAPAPATERRPEVIVDISDDDAKAKLVIDIVLKRDLNELKNIGGIQAVAEVFGSNLDGGLQDYPAPAPAPAVTMSSVKVQARELLRYMAKACKSVTILLLLISALLSLATEMLSEGPKRGWHDALFIIMAVLVLITFPSVSEFNQSRKLLKELEMANKLGVVAVRNGGSTSISIHHVEPGEIMELTKGCPVPGTGLFVDGSGLVVDEVLHSKIDHANPFLFSGSKVIEGTGRMIVTSVDKRLTPDKPGPKTLLQTRLEKPNSYADKIALCTSILITLVMLIRIFHHLHHARDEPPELKGRDALPKLMMIIERILVKPRGLVSVLTTALTVMVFSLRQGVSIVITFSLSYWNKKAELCHAKAKNLSACGTMGHATVICIDVSGGVLIFDEMEVVKCLIGENVIFDANGLEQPQVVGEHLRNKIAMSLLVHQQSPMDVSLCAWIKSELGLNEKLVNERFEFLKSKELRSNNCSGFLMKMRGVDNEDNLQLHCKGCPSSILEMCTHYYDCHGNKHALQCKKREFKERIKVMEDDCLRPIAFACKRTSVEGMFAEKDLSLLAIVGFKKSARIAMETLSKDGVKFILSSGDKPLEAKSIACDLGICKPGSEVVVLEGEEFRQFNEQDRREMVNKIQIMASSLPEDKVLMVQTLKEEGYVVVFLGGLATRDTPALKEADVGITMESHSPKMAQDSSDIVLTPGGSLGLLPSLRKHGRCSYQNIQKFIQLELTACISGVVITALTAIISGDSPISAVSLVYVNFIPCILGGFMMVMVLPNQEVITDQKIRHDSVMTPAMWRGFITQVLYQVSVLLIIHLAAKDIWGMNEKVRKSMIFNTLALCQIFNQFNIMGLEKKEIFFVAIKHCWFVVAVGMVIVVQVLVMEFERSLFNCAKLNRAEWAFCVLFAGLSWAFDRTLQFVSLFLGKRLFESSGTYMRAPTWMPPLFVAFLGLSFAMALVTGTRFINQDIAWAFS